LQGAFLTTATDVKNSPIRVVVAEDQALVRRGTALMISMAPDMECVGQACNGEEAVKLALALRPDVILMDLHMPLKGGVAATREITLAQPSTQVLVLTTLDDDETVFEAVRAGAQAYLLKDVSEEDLLETIRALRRGESRLTSHIARKIMDQFRSLARAHGAVAGSTKSDSAANLVVSTEELTDKEERILAQITDGCSNREIAHAMNLAEGTVKNYVTGIMEKLHANTRTELAVQMNRQRRGA
jgi:DNA-binding NarL/FixJ family response regulator